jgi:hypothetical protein
MLQDPHPDLLQAQQDAIEPQDEAMDQFRKKFRLMAGCRVSKDGKVMTYSFETMSAAHSCLSGANSIIIANKLPLKAGVRSVMKGRELCMVQLRIVYTPINK